MDSNLDILKKRILIENSLNEIKFHGVGVGDILCYELLIYADRISNINPLTLREKISIWSYKYGFRIKPGNTKKFDFTNQIMWVPTNFYEKFIEFYLPFSELKIDNVTFKLFHNDRSQKGTDFFYDLHLTFQQYLFWKKEFKNVISSIIQLLNNNLIKGLINEKQKKLLINRFIIKSQSVIQIDSLFKNSKPLAVITDYDRQNFNSLVINIARKYNIPTFTFIHGSTIPVNNFVPFLADHCFFWGEFHVNQFKYFIDSKKKYAIVGNPKFTRANPETKSKVCKKIGISEMDSTITLATNKAFNDYLEQARLFCEAVKNTNWLPIIKLHQVENKEEYENLKTICPKLLIFKDDLSLNEIFALSDFFLVQNSTIAIEAIMKGVPLAIFNPLNNESGICGLILKKSNTINFKSSIALNQFLKKSDKENIKSKIDIDSQNNFLKNYCKYFGRDSVEQVEKYLRKEIHFNE